MPDRAEVARRQALVHLFDLRHLDAERLGHGLRAGLQRRQITLAFELGGDLRLRATQLVKQLALGLRRADLHQGPGARMKFWI